MEAGLFPRPPRVGRRKGALSILASVASLGAFWLYGHWHWELGLRRTDAPAWLTWSLIDGLKLASIPLALLGLVLAILAVRREAWPFGLPALVLAVLAVLTIPIVT